jgi:hypothetical protein
MSMKNPLTPAEIEPATWWAWESWRELTGNTTAAHSIYNAMESYGAWRSIIMTSTFCIPWNGTFKIHVSFCERSRKTKSFCLLVLLGAFEKFGRTTPSFNISVRPPFRLSVCLHGTTWLPLYGFLWNLVFEYFSKICRGIWNFIKIRQERRVPYKKI